MKKTLFFILLALCLAACGREGADLPELLVIEGWIEDGKAPVVYVTTSLVPSEVPASLSDMDAHVVRWAKVTVSDGTEDVVLTGTYSKHFCPPFAYTTGRMHGVAGKTYRLTVEYSGVKAQAWATVPAPKPLDQVVPQRLDNGAFAIRASFTDDPLTEDYYRFFYKIEKLDSVFCPAPLCFMDDSAHEALVRTSHPLGRVEDRSGGFVSGDRVQVKFCTMERNMFLYWKAFEEQTNLSHVPVFTLDGNLPGNVEGERAIGYFAGYGATVYTVQIP